ncbi:MAG: hypothetical protein AAGI66_02030 [Cyanobacteria bacterium P01_H01_bin.74]
MPIISNNACFNAPKPVAKPFLGLLLSASLLLGPAMPLIAFADGDIPLKPMQSTNLYNNNNRLYNNTNTSNYTGTYGNYNLDTNAYNNAALYNNSLYNTNSNNTANSLGVSSGSFYNSATPATIYGRVASIPKGTVLTVTTDVPVSSLSAQMGDPVNGTIDSDVYVNDVIAIPAGSQVQGEVVNVNPAGHVGRHGVLDVRFSLIKLANGRTIPVHGHIVTGDESGVLKGNSYTTDIAKGVGIAAGATGVGTLMGTAAGGLLGSVGTGALFGLGVGALGGMTYAVARKGKEVVLPSGSRLGVQIDSATTVSN